MPNFFPNVNFEFHFVDFLIRILCYLKLQLYESLWWTLFVCVHVARVTLWPMKWLSLRWIEFEHLFALHFVECCLCMIFWFNKRPLAEHRRKKIECYLQDWACGPACEFDWIFGGYWRNISKNTIEHGICEASSEPALN